jgi:nicotinate-nucleotide adenylyltransferase
MSKKIRTGLYFGSFNPITNAHAAIMERAFMYDAMEELWVVLSPGNPDKMKLGILADEEHRLNMSKLFFNSISSKNVKLCDVEFSLKRPSYTKNTMDHLKKTHLDRDFVIVCGDDVLERMIGWKNAEGLISENKFLCFQRRDNIHELIENFPKEVVENALFAFDSSIPSISSTDVRSNIFEGEPYKHMVPEEVYKYLEGHDVYPKKKKDQ